MNRYASLLGLVIGRNNLIYKAIDKTWQLLLLGMVVSRSCIEQPGNSFNFSGQFFRHWSQPQGILELGVRVSCWVTWLDSPAYTDCCEKGVPCPGRVTTSQSTGFRPEWTLNISEVLQLQKSKWILGFNECLSFSTATSGLWEQDFDHCLCQLMMGITFILVLLMLDLRLQSCCPVFLVRVE